MLTSSARHIGADDANAEDGGDLAAGWVEADGDFCLSLIVWEEETYSASKKSSQGFVPHDLPSRSSRRRSGLSKAALRSALAFAVK